MDIFRIMDASYGSDIAPPRRGGEVSAEGTGRGSLEYDAFMIIGL